MVLHLDGVKGLDGDGVLPARLLGGPLAAAGLLDEGGAGRELLLGEGVEVDALGVGGEEFAQPLGRGAARGERGDDGQDFLRWRRSLQVCLPVASGSPQMPSRSSTAWKARPRW